MVGTVLLGAILCGGPARAEPAPDRAQLETLCRSKVRAAALLDAETGQPLFLYRAYDQLPPASTVKLMLLTLVAEAVETGRVSADDTLEVSRRAFKTGGQQLYLSEGERYALHDMALATAIHSANDAATVLAEGVFGSYGRAVAAMNAKARELGLAVTRFRTPHGLPASWGHQGDRSSAMDLARLGCEAVRHPRLLDWTRTPRAGVPGRDLVMVNSNALLGIFHGVDGLKTGFTQLARYCFVGTARRIATDGRERRLVCAVLGAESSRDRFLVTRNLFDYGFAHVERRVVVAKGATIGMRPVRDALGAGDVSLVAAAPLALWIDEKTGRAPTFHLVVPDSLDAPVYRGQTLGDLVVYLGNELVGRVTARAARTIEAATPWRRFLDTLALH